MSFSTYLFIDPSVNYVGSALFNTNGELVKVKEVRPAGEDWRIRSQQIVAELLAAHPSISPIETKIVVEAPIYFSGARGAYSFAGEKIQKLYYACGAITAGFKQKGFEVEEVPVRDCKKNITKEVTRHRVESIFGAGVSDSEHVIDAIYLGLWYGRRHGLWDLGT